MEALRQLAAIVLIFACVGVTATALDKGASPVGWMGPMLMAPYIALGAWVVGVQIAKQDPAWGKATSWVALGASLLTTGEGLRLLLVVGEPYFAILGLYIGFGNILVSMLLLGLTVAGAVRNLVSVCSASADPKSEIRNPK